MKVKHLKNTKWSKRFDGVEFQTDEISDVSDKLGKLLIDNGYAILVNDKQVIEEDKAITDYSNKAMEPLEDNKLEADISKAKRGRPRK